jgi:hypothetical protein
MDSLKKSGPQVSKTASYPFQIAVVSWIDLLGYGAMIAEAGFNPLHGKASEALARLRRFHAIVASHSHRWFPTLVVNDGAAAYRDLSLRSREPTHDFLVRTWRLFSEIKRDEYDHGLPGARVVLAAGFRMRGRRAGMDAMSDHLRSLMRRYKDGTITPDQAVREAAKIRRPFDIIPELQANFAFSKAYVAESSGKAGGLAGAKLFVDLTLFDTPAPKWIVNEEIVKWTNKELRMDASFVPIVDLLPGEHSVGGPPGVRDALQIAQDLTQDSDILDALRTAQKPR